LPRSRPEKKASGVISYYTGEERLPSPFYSEESGRGLDNALALDSDGPPDKLMQRETFVRLEKALKQLPAKQRQVVELHMLQGLSVEETAKSMGLTQPSAASHYFRAMRTLCALLEDPQ